MTTGGSIYSGLFTKTLDIKYPVVTFNVIETTTNLNRPTFAAQYGSGGTVYYSGLTRSIDGSGWYLFKDFTGVYTRTTGTEFNPSTLTKDSFTVFNITATNNASVSGSLTVAGSSNIFSSTSGTFQVNQPSTFANNIILTSSTALVSLGSATGQASSFAGIASSSIYTLGGLGVSGKSFLSGDVALAGNLLAGGNISVTGSTTLSGTLAVTGAATLNGSLTANGSSTFGNSSATGSLGTTSQFINVTAIGTTLSGATSSNFFITIQSPSITGGSSTNSGTMWINAPSLVGSTSTRNSAVYAATGDITIAANNSRLSILSSLAPANSTDTPNASINSSGGMIVVGAAYLNASLAVGTGVTTGGGITVGGNAAVSGTTTSTGNLTVNSTASSITIPPDSNTAVSIYTTGGVNVARKLYVGQESFFNGTLYSNGATTLAYGSATPLVVNSAGNLAVAGSTTVVSLTSSGTYTSNGSTIFNGAITLNSGASITAGSMTNNFDFSGSSGTFSTSTGTNTLNGSVSIAANKNITFVAGSGGISVATVGTGIFDFSNSSGVFKTSTGAVSLGGNTTLSTGNTLLFATGTTGINTASSGTGNFDFSNSSGIFKTSTGAVVVGGTAVITFGTATGYSITAVATTGSVNFGNMTGTFTTPTGAVVLSSAGNATTIGGTLTVTQATTLTGTATLNGAATINNTVTMSSGNNFTFGTTGNTGNMILNGQLLANNISTFASSIIGNATLAVGTGTSSTNALTLANSIGSTFLVDSTYKYSLNTTLTTVGINAFRIPQLISGTGTTSTASTVWIEGAPTASGGVVITSTFALYVSTGNVYFAGNQTLIGTLSVSGSSTFGTISSTNLTVSGTTTCQGAFASQTSAQFTFATSSGTGASTSPFFNIAAATYSLTSGTSPVSFVTIQPGVITTGTSSEGSTFVIVGPPTGATVAWSQKITNGGLLLAGASAGTIIRNTGTAASSTSAFDNTASISTGGGVSVNANLYVGTTGTFGTGLTIVSGGILVTAGSTSVQALNAAGDLKITSGTDASGSTGTIGSLATLGGLSVAKTIYGGTGLTISLGGAAITGTSSITGTLLVSGAATLQSTLAVTSNATVGGTLVATGAASANGGLGVSISSISGTGMTTSTLFNVAGTTYTSSSGTANIYFSTISVPTVSGTAARAATLVVLGKPTGAGVTSTYSFMTIAGPSLFASTDAQIIIQGTNDSASAADATASFSTLGGMSIAKKLFVGTNLGVAGISNLGQAIISGNVSIISTNTLSVGGATTLSGTLTVTGVSTLNNQLYVSNSNNVSLTTLPIDSNASIATQGGVSIALAASVNGILQSATQVKCISTTDSASYTDTAASIYTAGGATITKQLNVGTNLSVQQNASVLGNLTVSGTLTTVNSQTLTITNHIAIVNFGPQPGALIIDAAYLMARNGTSIVSNATDNANKISTTITSNYTASSTSIVIAATTALNYYNGWIISDGTNTASISASPAAITGSVTLTLDAALRATSLTSGSSVFLYSRRYVGIAWDESDNQMAVYGLPRDSPLFDPNAVDGSAAKFANFGCNNLQTYGNATINGNLSIAGTLQVAPNPVVNTLITGGSYTITSTDIAKTQNFFISAAGTVTIPQWSSLSASVAASYAGKSYLLRIINLSAGVVTIATSGSDTIDGDLTTYTLDTKYRKITLMSADSGAWIIL